MKRKIIFLILFAILLIFAKNAYAAPENAPSNDPIHQVDGKKMDRKAKILSQYLSKYNSPLQDFAQDFVDAADKYEIDWKLVAAISGVESTFGKAIPGGYNGWGWGVYGDNAIYFKSWKEAIYTISEGLKKNYIDKGYKDPYQINRKYAESKTWGSKVDYFMKDIEAFAQNYEDKNPVTKVETSTQTAADSGQLANKN